MESCVWPRLLVSPQQTGSLGNHWHRNLPGSPAPCLLSLSASLWIVCSHLPASGNCSLFQHWLLSLCWFSSCAIGGTDVRPPAVPGVFFRASWSSTTDSQWGFLLSGSPSIFSSPTHPLCHSLEFLPFSIWKILISNTKCLPGFNFWRCFVWVSLLQSAPTFCPALRLDREVYIFTHCAREHSGCPGNALSLVRSAARPAEEAEDRTSCL